jgi:hypothetical protein
MAGAAHSIFCLGPDGLDIQFLASDQTILPPQIFPTVLRNRMGKAGENANITHCLANAFRLSYILS